MVTMRLAFAACFIAVLGLGACATPTPYQPAVGERGFGYFEQPIEQDRLRIGFRGNSLTDRAEVEDYLLYRAAEVALARGAQHFIVVERDVESRTRFVESPGRSRFQHLYYHPFHGWSPFYDPFWDDRSLREVTRYEASAEVVFGFGPKPEGDPNAYDAATVRDTLGPRLVLPEG